MNGGLSAVPKRPRTNRTRALLDGRARAEAVLARRGTRERLVLTLLLYERLAPIEVADALGLSLRQVERTYDSLLVELRRTLARGSTRVDVGALSARQRRAA